MLNNSAHALTVVAVVVVPVDVVVVEVEVVRVVRVVRVERRRPVVAVVACVVEVRVVTVASSGQKDNSTPLKDRRTTLLPNDLIMHQWHPDTLHHSDCFLWLDFTHTLPSTLFLGAVVKSPLAML